MLICWRHVWRRHPHPFPCRTCRTGILWRLAHQLGDRDEPILSDQRLMGLRYRLVQGVRAMPYYVSQGTWNYLRTGFEVRPLWTKCRKRVCCK